MFFIPRFMHFFIIMRPVGRGTNATGGENKPKRLRGWGGLARLLRVMSAG